MDGLSFAKALTLGGVALGASAAVGAVGEDGRAGDVVDAAATRVESTGAEEEKKDVIEALDFGFLVALVARSAALRLRGVAIGPCRCETREKAKRQSHFQRFGRSAEELKNVASHDATASLALNPSPKSPRKSRCASC